MNNAVISIAAALALLALAGFFLYRERSRPGLFLCAALVVTALLELFDLQALAASGDAFFWKKCAVMAEALLPALWILSSLTFARQSGPWKIGRLLQGLLAVTFLTALLPILLPLDTFLYAPDFPGESLVFLQNGGFFYYLWIMACLVFALMQFEKTFANASPAAQFKIKYDIIGLGTILAVLIFYYSQALLYRTLNMNYLPVRSFLYLVATGMAAYSLSCRRGNVRIAVSRQAAFKSVVLIAVGVYLLLIGLLGEGMQHFGFSFPRTVTVSFAFLLGIALLILMLSGRVRREVKVVLHKNFYQNKHDYRTQWLNFTMQLSTSRSGEELLQRILSAYCDVFGIEGAALFLYDESCDGYSMTAGFQMKPIEDVIQRGNSLISFMKERAWVVCIRDDNPEIMSENGRLFMENQISFVVPLIDGEHIEGFIMLGRVTKEDEVYIYEDYDLMKTIARQAALAILHQKLSEQITLAREIEAIGKVATFVAHDLKNQVSNLSLIVENAARHISNPEFQQDMLVSLGNTVEKMQKLIASLKNLGEKELYTPQSANLLELVKNTAALFAGSKVIVSGTAQMVRVDVEEIQKVVMNLLMNAVEASAPDQQLVLEVGAAVGVPYVRVTDWGCGMAAGFIRTELFKPFRTSKSQGLGIGLYQCRQIVEAHGGRIEVSSVPGSGSVFTVWFRNDAAGEELSGV
ncbi:MAG: PEP-CTERM system histidine kinase PrsK [Steroidobacteraceae bacterium]|nr:PEP-CTERM system histidine kinase PrsK [Deltaproteobacteria bacterium]